MEVEEPSIRAQLHRYYGLGAVDDVPEAVADQTASLRSTFATPHEAKEYIMELEVQKLRSRATLMSRGKERAEPPPLSRTKSDPLIKANKAFDDVLSRYDDWHRSFNLLTQSKVNIGYSPTKTRKNNPELIEPISGANSEMANIARTPLLQKLIWGNDRAMIHAEDHSVTSMSWGNSSMGALSFTDDDTITPALLKSNISLQATKHRQHLLHKNKQELNKLQDIVDRNKALDQENMTTNIAAKRLINGFRQQILHRLMSKNENLAPSYMRYFNEEVAAEFLKQYNGCTISIDAIIAHIGKSLGEKTDKVAIPQLQCKKPKISKFTSQFMKISRNGVRRPHDPCTDVLLSLSPEQLREKRRKQEEDDEESVFSQYSQQAGDASPTVSEADTSSHYSPSNVPTSLHKKGTDKDKRKGGGYKSKYHKTTNDTDLIVSNTKSGLIEHNLVDYKHPEYTLEKKQMEAIELVQSQLVQEKMLPSLFPQQVLTEDQLTKLGTGTSFEEIFKSMQLKKMMDSRREQGAPPSPIKSKVVAVKRVYLKERMGPPIALATRNYPLKVENENTPAESPYLSLIGTVPDKTKILAHGIPAGSGLSLWSGKRVERRVVKLLH